MNKKQTIFWPMVWANIAAFILGFWLGYYTAAKEAATLVLEVQGK